MQALTLARHKSSPPSPSVYVGPLELWQLVESKDQEMEGLRARLGSAEAEVATLRAGVKGSESEQGALGTQMRRIEASLAYSHRVVVVRAALSACHVGLLVGPPAST